MRNIKVSWQELWPWGSSRNKDLSILNNEGMLRLFDAARDIASYEFVVFDTELTGLNRHRDEIVSIAAIRIRGMRISLDDSFHSLVRTTKKDFGEGTFVHRITPQQLRMAPPPEEVLPVFTEFCRDSVLVGHLPELDFSFLHKASRLVLGGVLCNPCLDSMKLARVYWKLGRKKRLKDLPRINSFNLTELSIACRLPLFATHDALGDALQTACLFLYLVTCLKRLGITTFKDFHRVGGIR
jgi:DNA polymerase III subunit epsilon